MKKLILSTAIFFSCLSIQIVKAQLSVNINIGSQPEWGPVGYDHVDYYYIPDIDTYYDVPAHQYVYYNNNAWVHSRALPAKYKNYNLYNGYKVVVNEHTPWVHNDIIRTKYVGYKDHKSQVIIRDSHDVKYAKHWTNNSRKAVKAMKKERKNERKKDKH
ncbi:hypothetical protein [Mucilaginibacter segetis]|uniref:DUF3300 domain-containing protein n=1 Tax=Mucilaginibacter segetis TaxID=2793071 RepID=A0A934PSQ9_9SPHI|nr:hypothetical protein [Mucilaginibacter segetis]MBK0380118.1 hypothetical protein [Mucilaginibacter segetis]